MLKVISNDFFLSRPLSFNVIDGISFTDREIDVIAGMLNFGGAALIAQHLRVSEATIKKNLYNKATVKHIAPHMSPKTVETYISKVRSKVQDHHCHNIKKFVEYTNTFDIFRKHSQYLSLENMFLSSLEKIRKTSSNRKDKNIYQIESRGLSQDEVMLLQSLTLHLALAGIDIEDKRDGIKPKKIILFENIEEQNKNVREQTDINQDKVIDIGLGKADTYYDLVFAILEQVLSEQKVDIIWKEFNKSYSKYNKGLNPILYPEVRSNIGIQAKQRKIIVSILVFVLLLVSVGGYYKSAYSRMTENKQIIYQSITNNFPNLLSSSENFIGRQDILKQIYPAFKNNKVLVVSGRSGIGKSTVILEYAKQQSKNQKIRFFNASNITNLKQEFQELAYELNINIVNDQHVVIKNLIYNKLESMPVDILFIFDDANEYDEIKDYFVSLPHNINVIITTKQQKLFPNIPHIFMSNFSEQEATEYIQTVLNNNRNYDHQVIKNIIETVGTLPHNLKIATAYLLNNPISDWQQFYTSIGTPENNIFMSIAKIDDLDSKCIWELLQYIVCLDSTIINATIINHLFPLAHQTMVNKIIRKLEALSLISIDTNFIGDIKIRIHPDVLNEIKLVIKARSVNKLENKKLYSNLLYALDNALPTIDYIPNKNWILASSLVPHIVKMLDQNQIPLSVKKHATYGNILYKLGRFYSSSANVDFKQALSLTTKALKVFQSLDRDQNRVEIADSLESLGVIYLYGFPNKIDEGLKLFKRSLEIRLKLYRNPHADVAQSFYHIHLVYLRKDLFHDALEYVLKALEILQQLHISDTLLTAQRLNDVAWCYYMLGEYNNTHSYVLKSLNVFNHNKHIKSSEMVYALHTLGATLLKLGRIQAGIMELEKAKQIIHEYGMEKHYTASCIFYDLANAYLKLKELDKAKKHILLAVKTREFLYKLNNHPVALVESLKLLEAIHLAAGNKKDAKIVNEKINSLLS